jgi:hypothetical protein
MDRGAGDRTRIRLVPADAAALPAVRAPESRRRCTGGRQDLELLAEAGTFFWRVASSNAGAAALQNRANMEAASSDGVRCKNCNTTIALPADISKPQFAYLRLAVAGELRSVQDGALEQAWPWRGEPSEVRYGFYDAYEQLEVAMIQTLPANALAEAAIIPAAGARRAARATVARWDLQGRLLALTMAISTATLVAASGRSPDLAHIINAQRAYGHYTAWWFLQRDVDPFPDTIPVGRRRHG